MKRLVNHWICGLALVGLIAGGCAPLGRPLNMSNNSSQNDNPQPLSFYATGNEGSQTEQLLIIERSTKVTNNVQTLPPSGGLKVVLYGHKLPMPLKHVDVNATVHGYISTVNIKQEFENPYAQKIEAVYEFKLPEGAGMDDFVITIGKRRIRGIIRERKMAEAIYANAKQLGFLALFLSADQTDTFRQTIANIEPGNNIDVDIHYFQTLHLENGWYEFVFPTASTTKGSSEEQHVPVSLRVDVNAGAPIAELQCPDDAVKKSITPEHWTAQLSPETVFPKEDFKLRYRLANDQRSSDFVSYRDERGGYFTLLLHSPNDSSNLSNVKIDWGAMKVSEIYPNDFTNITAGHAVLIAGRFMGTLPAEIVVTGSEGNQPISFSVPVDSSKADAEKILPKIWASMKIAALTQEAIRTSNLDFITETRKVALDYDVVSPYTAFLAVDASEPTTEGKTITVPAVP